MSNLVFNPQCKDYFKAKALVAISRCYNYAGSCRTYRFPYVSFKTWNSSYRAAFCYVFKRLEDAACKDDRHILVYSDICTLFDVHSWTDFYEFLELYLRPYFTIYYYDLYTPVEKLSFTYRLLDSLIKYNLGMVRYDLVSSVFGEKSAIRYASLKYFPDTSFIDIESDFMFKDVMD